MSVYLPKRLNVQSEHHFLWCKHLLYFESNWLLEKFSQHVRVELRILQIILSLVVGHSW